MSFNDDSANARRFHGRREPWENDVRWPNGASLALSFVLNIEEGAELSVADGDEANESVHAVTHRIDGHPDYCLATHFEYGARICHAHPSLSEATKEAALAVDKRTLNF